MRTRAATACTVSGREDLDGRDDRVDATATSLHLVCEPQDGDEQRDVGLDGGDDVGRRDVILGEHRQQPVARLGERRKRLERFEGHRQATAMALVLMTLTRAGEAASGGRGATRTLCGGGLPGLWLRLRLWFRL